MATHPIYIKMNDLAFINAHLRAFKDSLLEAVNTAGGITQLAKNAGIPQPSLSRFFNSDAMPQRSTLLKIAKALNLAALPVNLDESPTMESRTYPSPHACVHTVSLDHYNEALDWED
ncbi:MAG TPA: helix-turn-helix transcriptional regulator [Gammaproteobacteria bacterium]|nr:helix-turn-helix transcriptional regulator [Gammaproteobacteria bacterium]